MLKGRYGRKRRSPDNESADAVMQVFARTTNKSLRQCYREISIEKSSVHGILRAQKWKPYIPRIVHALNVEDPDRLLQFCEWFRRTRWSRGYHTSHCTGSGVRGFKPAGVNGYFQSVKIPSFGREVKPWVPCRRISDVKEQSKN